jgi:PTH1 family peptidyl-tRNA hydrolase
MAKRSDRPEIIALLGNQGKQYERTRHNAGWMLTPFLTPETTWQSKFKGRWQKVVLGGRQIVLLEPLTMMNLSGESVQAAASFFRVDPDSIAVAHDDVELGFGEAGIRFGGGLAGHNGLRSVAKSLGTQDFWRIRIGVGRPAHGELRAHVLGRFTQDEEAVLPDVLGAIARDVLAGLEAGFPSRKQKFRAVDVEQS